ncbi:hypothetical protein V6N12_024131 [Hibiscus sabdariffa]|uniref:Uncharacterized protein n=1 Tax=Hibiscus sabdariffa TaxID=183260 RepID=A0ABR2FZP7_9ROSI
MEVGGRRLVMQSPEREREIAIAENIPPKALYEVFFAFPRKEYGKRIKVIAVVSSSHGQVCDRGTGNAASLSSL